MTQRYVVVSGKTASQWPAEPLRVVTHEEAAAGISRLLPISIHKDRQSAERMAELVGNMSVEATRQDGTVAFAGRLMDFSRVAASMGLKFVDQKRLLSLTGSPSAKLGQGKNALDLHVVRPRATNAARVRGAQTATWYHGDKVAYRRFPRDWKWDRDRTTHSMNEEGPGIYFTTKYEQAASYGPTVVEVVLPKSFRLMPKKKASMTELKRFFEQADEDDKDIFLSNWNYAPAQEVLQKYSRQTTLHDALITLYADLFRYDADAWIQAVRTLGYDGVVIEKSYGVKHLIVWNPEALDDARSSEREENPRAHPGWVESVSGEHRRRVWTNAKGTIRIQDAGGKTAERFQVFHMQGGRWLEDVGWPSLLGAIEYAEGKRRLRGHPNFRTLNTKSLWRRLVL
jgi:hypothetical protein